MKKFFGNNFVWIGGLARNCYFGLGDGSDYIYRGQAVLRGVHTHEPLSIKRKEKDVFVRKASENIFPVYYLVRVGKFDYKVFAKAPLEQWMNYLKTGEIGEHDDAPGLPEAREKLKYDAMTPAQQKNYCAFRDDVRVKQEAIQDSREEGRALEKFENARNLKSLGVAPEIIAKALNLPIEEVNKL